MKGKMKDLLILLFIFIYLVNAYAQCDFDSIAAGGYHTIALKTDGTVWAWGGGRTGQLGNGDTININTPMQVVGEGGVGFLTDVIAVACGDLHTIAIKTDSTVWAWGSNHVGQLGNGHSGGDGYIYDPGIDSNTPVQVIGPDGVGFLTDIIAIEGGDNHSVALKSDGTVWTWGSNNPGQLGNGTTTNSSTPVQVIGSGCVGFLTDAIAIAAGHRHSIALISDSTVWCWGYNSDGQLGDGTNDNRRWPVQVVGPGGVGTLNGVISIAGGYGHTIALKSDSTVWTFGNNGLGQLGDGTEGYSRNTPDQVIAQPGVSGFLTDIIKISGGNYHTIALKSDSTGFTFGYNRYGQLGDGDTINQNRPVQVLAPDTVSFLTDIVACAGGQYHTAMLKSDGSASTFGYNLYGQLGDGSGAFFRKIPTEVDCSALGIYTNKEVLSDEIYLFIQPNPFNSIVLFTAPEGANISVFDLDGRKIDELNGDVKAWNPEKSLGSGVYFVRAKYGNEEITKRVVYLK